MTMTEEARQMAKELFLRIYGTTPSEEIIQRQARKEAWDNEIEFVKVEGIQAIADHCWEIANWWMCDSLEKMLKERAEQREIRNKIKD